MLDVGVGVGCLQDVCCSSGDSRREKSTNERSSKKNALQNKRLLVCLIGEMAAYPAAAPVTAPFPPAVGGLAVPVLVLGVFLVLVLVAELARCPGGLGSGPASSIWNENCRLS